VVRDLVLDDLQPQLVGALHELDELREVAEALLDGVEALGVVAVVGGAGLAVDGLLEVEAVVLSYHGLSQIAVMPRSLM